jgi:nucleoside-diphosphate-sugar epimerase
MMFDTNVLGTRNVVAASLDAGVESIVVAGSSSEYGRVSRPHAETDPPHPESDYAWTKATATAWCEWKGRAANAAITTLRLYSVYGPWEEPSRLVTYVMGCCLRREYPQVTAGTQPRDIIYVDDAIALLKIASQLANVRDIGFHLSLAGIVTFPKALELKEVARMVPLDRLLVETDSPFLAPVPHRGSRNEPARVVRVAEVIAELRGMTLEAIDGATSQNFDRLFAP